jgi:hypothetical protein
MSREHAPPGFWQWADELVLLDGVELESAVPTRFFQTVDASPPEWGRLSWRIQLNKVVDGRAEAPFFRTFYSGVEWNLSHSDDRWFLTAWCRWEQLAGERGTPRCVPPARIERETILFPIPPPDPGFDRPLYLRSRVDARDRRLIAEAVQSESNQPAPEDEKLILLDDFMED